MTLQFTNLDNGEVRRVEVKLVTYWCPFEWRDCYQVRTLDGEPFAEDGHTPEEAMDNGPFAWLPEEWGFPRANVKREWL